MSETKPRPDWRVPFFGVVFVGIGLTILWFGVVPIVHEWQKMRHWQQVEVQPTHLEVITTDNGSQILSLVIRYRYRIDGRNFTGTRLGIHSGFGDLDGVYTRHSALLAAALRDQRSVPAWVNPADHQQAVLDRDMRWWILTLNLGLSLLAGAAGIAVIVFVKPTHTGHPESISKPWLSRREWASATIPCDSPFLLWVMWPVVLCLNALASLIWFELPAIMAEGQRADLLLAIIPIIGWGFLIAAVQYTRSRLRFGKVAVVLDPYPGSIGGQVAGSAELRLPYDSRHAFGVELSCKRSYLLGSGRDRSRQTDPVWEARGYAYSSASATGTRLDFCFEVPPDLPSSEPNGEFYHFWKLELSATLPGRDLYRACELPVFPTAERSSVPRALSIEHPLARQAPTAVPAPRPGFRVGETLRPGNDGDNRPRSANEVTLNHQSRMLAITPELVAQMERDAPAALSRRAPGMTFDEIAGITQLMLSALLSLAALWLWGVPAVAMLLFLLAGAWIGIASEWLKYLLMSHAVEHESAQADADRFVWAIASSLRAGKSEVEEASLGGITSRGRMLLDLVLGGVATMLMLAFVEEGLSLSELHLEPAVLMMVAGMLALQVGGVLMMAWRHRGGHGAVAPLQFQAGGRGLCLLLLMMVALVTNAAMADGGGLRMALTIANLVILGAGSLALFYGVRILSNETRWLREHMQEVAAREPR